MLTRILRPLAWLPLALLHRAGAVLGWLVYWASPTYARRLRDNLYASRICTDAAACRGLLHAAIAEAGKGVVELAKVWLGDDDSVALLVECEDWHLADAAHARGNGVILLTPHQGCFEIAGLYAAQRLPLTVLYRPPRVRWLEPLMIAGRSRWQAVVAPANLRGVRMLYKALVRGDAVGLLPDQAPGAGEGTWAEFFGRPAYTMTLVRRLQQASGATAIMAFAERLPHGRGYRLHLEEVPGQLPDETALNRAIEAQVRRCPEQYLWSYNRYKIPAGSKPPEF